MDEKDTFKNSNSTEDVLANPNVLGTIFSIYGGDDRDKMSLQNIIVITCYSVIIIVSIFGNLLVCNIVARRASMRRTTYVLIANLALSDLLMTVLNIPFKMANYLLDHWPFGEFMCSFVQLVLVTSVYVSTFTMMLIALDRHRVICKPLMPRLGPVKAMKAIVLVWLVAILFAVPHAIFNEISQVQSYRILVRCRTKWPGNLSLWVTLITVATQFVLPLSVTGILYFFIVARVWSRDVLGVVTEAQMITQAKAKRKTVKMLLLVVILFAICWLPMNVYNVLVDFRLVEYTFREKIYFVCHLLAMSSVCYNPFIYCWLNKNFRSGAVSCFRCIRNISRKLNSSFMSTREFRLTDIRCDLHSQSYDSRTDSMLNDFRCSGRRPRQISGSSHQHSSRKFAKESVPMKSFYVTKFPNHSAYFLVENKRHEFGSLPNVETSFNSMQNCSIKKCLSWSQ